MFFERPDAGETAILVHVDFQDEQDREDPGELLELVRSAGAVPATLIQGSRRRPDPRSFIGMASSTRSSMPSQPTRELVIFKPRSVSLPGAQSRAQPQLPCARSHGADPGYLRAARADPRRQTAGRTGSARVHVDPAGARLDPLGASEGRYRLARSGRDPARDRPQAAARSHQVDSQAPRESAQAARSEPPGAGPGRGAQRLAGGLHQRRQVDAVQRHHRGRGLRCRSALRHARPDP